MNDAGALGVSSAHVVATRGMGSLGRGHGADESHLVHFFGELWKAVTELDAIDVRADRFCVASDVRWGIGFGVEGVDVGHASRHEEVDDAGGFSSACGDDGGISSDFLSKEAGCAASDGETEACFCCIGEETTSGDFVELMVCHGGVL